MNLRKLFNGSFLIQNLKKSIALLTVILGLIPILNIIALLIYASTGNYGLLIDLTPLSIVNSVGIFIVPFILSVCLFGFVFKKKSVDFIGSMPIDRKTIFVTNSIGGILIIIGTMLINIVGFSIISLIFNDVFIPFALLIDYFLFWTISYIFVFIVTNVALSVSGNMLTQIVVTLLLLFLVPFVTDYASSRFSGSYYHDVDVTCTSDDCKPEYYYCYSNKLCAINKELGIYYTSTLDMAAKNYTMPYHLFYLAYSSYEDSGNLWNGMAIVKMMSLSIIYFGLGLFLFLKRKMEVCETSFKSQHAHSIVKLLTMVPILIILLELVREGSLIVVIFALVIVVAYYLIYDLITRRSLVKFSLSIIYLLIILAIMPAFSYVVNYRFENYHATYNVDDIKNITFLKGDYNAVITDRDVINFLMKHALNQYSEKPDAYQYESKYADFLILLKNGTEYKMGVQMEKSEYQKLIDLLMKNEEYLKYNKKFNYNKVIALQIGDFVVNSDKYKDLIKKIETVTSTDEYKKNSLLSEDYGETISLYTYSNHNYETRTVQVSLIPDLLNVVSNFHNQKALEAIQKWSIELYNQIELVTPLPDYDDYYYLSEWGRGELRSFAISSARKEFDYNKEYIVLRVWIQDAYYYVYSNDVEEFKSLLEGIRESVKDTDEYKYWNDGYLYQ